MTKSVAERQMAAFSLNCQTQRINWLDNKTTQCGWIDLLSFLNGIALRHFIRNMLGSCMRICVCLSVCVPPIPQISWEFLHSAWRYLFRTCESSQTSSQIVPDKQNYTLRATLWHNVALNIKVSLKQQKNSNSYFNVKPKGCDFDAEIAKSVIVTNPGGIGLRVAT